MALDIQFNHDNVMEERVGGEGLSAADLNEKESAGAVDAFRARVKSGEIGFTKLPEDTATMRAIQRFTENLRPEIDNVLLLGIGGSALGAYALDVAIRGPHPIQTDPGGKKGNHKKAARPRLVVLDNVDPGVIAAALERLNPKYTAVCVIAKSGSTAETLGTFLVVREWLIEALGKKARERIVAITDPEKGDLLAAAKEEKYTVFHVPPNVGGRFSVFCPVGLVPAALIGLDIAKLLDGAADANDACWSKSWNRNAALRAAVVHHGLDTQLGKRIEVVFPYSSYLWGSAFWYRQLWAESLGKRVNRAGEEVFAGQTPVAALGVTDQHSQLQLYTEGPRDKMITFWRVTKPRADVKIPRELTNLDTFKFLGGKTIGALFRAEADATQAALTEAARPNCRWTLPRVDEYNVGAFFQMLMFQTAFAGELYGVNAFDQPGVELGKKMTYGLLGRKGFEEYAGRVKMINA